MTFDEFVDVFEKVPQTTRDELMKAFRKIDINGDGFITNKELLKVMTTVSRYSFNLLEKNKIK